MPLQRRIEFPPGLFPPPVPLMDEPHVEPQTGTPRIRGQPPAKHLSRTLLLPPTLIEGAQIVVGRGVTGIQVD